MEHYILQYGVSNQNHTASKVHTTI